MRRLFHTVLSVAAVAAFGAGAAGAQELQCGAVITADVRLTASLIGCEADGLVVGADHVTVDLNGFSIEGAPSASGTGVLVDGRNGVTVKRGSIRNFSSGVWFTGSEHAMTSNSEARDLEIQNVGQGIRVGSQYGTYTTRGIRLIGNMIRKGGTGIYSSFALDLHVERNLLAGLGDGLFAHHSPGLRIVKNTASGNAGWGMYLWASGGLVEGNVSNGNRTGIETFDQCATLSNNVTNGNSVNGVHLWRTDRWAGCLRISRHVANANGETGIRTNTEDVVQGDRNRARANGLTECVGVICNS